jgi:hypothetical protein
MIKKWTVVSTIGGNDTQIKLIKKIECSKYQNKPEKIGQIKIPGNIILENS